MINDKEQKQAKRKLRRNFFRETAMKEDQDLESQKLASHKATLSKKKDAHIRKVDM